MIAFFGWAKGGGCTVYIGIMYLQLLPGWKLGKHEWEALEDGSWLP